MPNITDISCFNKGNVFSIPLANPTPATSVSEVSPNSASNLQDMITRYEKKVLLNSLGLAFYQELQDVLPALNDPANLKYKKLVEGDVYDNKVWNGLKNDHSFLVAYIYYQFVTETNDSLSAIGVAQLGNQNRITPKYRIVNAYNDFLKQYQISEFAKPFVYNHGGVEVVDYFRADKKNDIEVSLEKYLIDKMIDFPNWKREEFLIYRNINTLGI